MGCGHAGVSNKAKASIPSAPLEVQCPLLRPRSEQNRSLGGRASDLVIAGLAATAIAGSFDRRTSGSSGFPAGFTTSTCSRAGSPHGRASRVLRLEPIGRARNAHNESPRAIAGNGPAPWRCVCRMTMMTQCRRKSPTKQLTFGARYPTRQGGSLMTAGSRSLSSSTSASSSSSLGSRGGTPMMVTRSNQLETFSGMSGVMAVSRCMSRPPLASLEFCCRGPWPNGKLARSSPRRVCHGPVV